MRPEGIYPILYAFFDARDRLNRAPMRAQVNACIDSGAHGVAILGLITEVSALSTAERRTVVEWVAEDIGGRVPLAVTIAGSSVAEATSLALHAQNTGADWLILQPPLGAKPSGQALLRFFDQVMEKVQIPIGIQNVPEILGIGLSTDEIVRLHRQHAHFTVMKGEGPVVAVKQYLDRLQGEVAVFNGRGGMELPDNLRAGCAGMIPAPDCADHQIALFNAYKRGDQASVDTIYHRILPYVIFAMQRIDFHVVYGKRMFANRIGLAGEPAHRFRDLAIEPFFLEAMHRWSVNLGPYRRQS
ncbi:MAG: dihydrodipicolinate synthase family protein [Gammaproteobacteria bacterium]|nr:dihydrodipicolinate synthase family protein [Gammaproteobacteria bacterium]